MSEHNQNEWRKVFIVGAGPGDPELITVKGLNILKRADVIFYDRLVNMELIRDLKAKKVFVGKRKNIHYRSQEEINALLVESAKSGRVTVRLKGGDPLVFGRGGEEMEALIENGIDFEIIPGLSSISAVTSHIGLPLTHRNISSSIAVVTGHTKNGEDTSSVPRADTLIFLMGLSALSRIVASLVHEGYDVNSRIAVISKGTLRDERYVSGTLATIEEIVEKNKIAPPAIVVFGGVVGWYDGLMKKKCDLSDCGLVGRLMSICR